jgi:hypothetical protein
VYQVKRFVFSIDSDELVINANSILEAVAEVKELMKVIEGEHTVKFVGVKY